MRARNARLDQRLHTSAHIMGQRATVGVTQHNPARAGIIGRLGRSNCIIRIGLEPVKEMLCIKQRLAPLPCDMCNGCFDIFDVFVQRYPQRSLHMKIMRFTHQTNRRSARIHNRRQHIVVVSGPTGPFGHPERCHGCTGLWHGLKKLGIRGVRPRPTAFDVIDPKIIQHRRYRVLFCCRKLHALGLLPVAQCGVIKIQTLHQHHSCMSLLSKYPGERAARGSAPLAFSRAKDANTTPRTRRDLVAPNISIAIISAPQAPTDQNLAPATNWPCLQHHLLEPLRRSASHAIDPLRPNPLTPVLHRVSQSIAQ